MSKDGRGQQGFADLPFTPWGEAEWKAYDAANGGLYRRLPAVRHDPLDEHARADAVHPERQVSRFLFEANHGSPWCDRRPRAPQGRGDVVRRLVDIGEGDTLVVDTVNFNGKTRLDTIGHPHSDRLHLTQRFSRPDLGHISYEVIVDDPKTFTKPWKNVRTLWLRTDWEMMEYSCEENNKSLWEGRIKVPKYKP